MTVLLGGADLISVPVILHMEQEQQSHHTKVYHHVGHYSKQAPDTVGAISAIIMSIIVIAVGVAMFWPRRDRY